MVAAFSGSKSNGNGFAFLLASGVVWEIIAFCCSSPQTAEINIRKRHDTLMKWVHLGQALAVVNIAIAASIDKNHRKGIIAGGLFAMTSAELFYAHAKQAGLSKPQQPETEQY
jgi:hypothetical protein